MNTNTKQLQKQLAELTAKVSELAASIEATKEEPAAPAPPTPEWAVNNYNAFGGWWVTAEVDGIWFNMRWIEPSDECDEGYWVAETPCTQDLYKAVMSETPSHFEGAQRPVECVTWQDAVEFCRRLSELLPGSHFELLSEEEWEHCCRAGSEEDTYGPLDEIAWYASNSGNETHEVKTKKPNAWGLYDTLGNVWEWTRSKVKE